MAGDDLDAIDPAVGDPLGGAGISGDDLLDHLGAQSLGDDLEALLWFVAGCDCPRCHSALAVHDFPAGVEELGEEGGTVTVDRLGDGSVSGDRGVVGGHEHMVRVAGGLVDAGDLEDDEPAAALGSCFVIGDKILADLSVVIEDRVVARGHDAIADAPPAQCDGFEEVGEQ